MQKENKYFDCSDRAMQYLSEKDAKLGAVIEYLGPIQRQINDDLFECVVQTIVGQQISNAALDTIWQRIVDAYEDITVDSIVSSTIDQIQSYGISYRKAEYIMDFAQKVHNGELIIDTLYDMDDDRVIETLSGLKGIGRWTAEMLMLFCMQRQDIFSYGDLGICRGVRMLHHHRHVDEELFDKYRRMYSPYGSVASLYMWAISSGAVEGMRDYAPRKVEITRVSEIKTKCAVYPSEYGDIAIKYTRRAVVSISIVDSDVWLDSVPSQLSDIAYQQLSEYFTGQRQRFDFPIDIVGTEFQKKVWKQLLRIPYGETRSYRDIAVRIGSPKSSRAIGMANNKNPLLIVVPCHRVIGTNGRLTGYAAGIDMKSGLLDMESNNIQV